MFKSEKNYFTIQGRINSKTMFHRCLITFFVIVGIQANFVLTGLFDQLYTLIIIGMIGHGYLAIQTAKRLHDAGMSGHRAWNSLIPVFGFLYGLYTTMLEEQEGENKYGPAPIPDTIVMSSSHSN